MHLGTTTPSLHAAAVFMHSFKVQNPEPANQHQRCCMYNAMQDRLPEASIRRHLEAIWTSTLQYCPTSCCCAFECKRALAQVWSSGWGPEALAKLDHASGMLGSWKVVLNGDFTGIPFTALWRHR